MTGTSTPTSHAEIGSVLGKLEKAVFDSVME
jgi:hypothetical protein